jgi:hypothetical protein
MNEAAFRKLSRREGNRGVLTLEGKEVEQLLAGNAVTPEASCGTAGRSGETASCASATTFAYVGDYDVEIAEDAAQCDPIVLKISEGVSLLVRPLLDPAGDSVTLEIECGTLKLNCPIETFSPGAEHIGDIMLPDAVMSSFSTTVSVPLDKTVLVCVTGFRHDSADTEGGGAYAVLVTPRAAAARAPLQVSKDVSLGVFNVEDVLLWVRNFLTPGMAEGALPGGIPAISYDDNGQAAPAGDMFNGTVFLDDITQPTAPQASSTDSLAGLVCRIEPESLITGTSVFSAERGIVITCKPDVLAKAGAFLHDQASRRSRMMETELYVLSVDGNLMAQTLDGNISGALPPEAAETLLKEAAAGQQASVLGHVMLTSVLGRWASAAQTRIKTYVRDYDIEIATGVSIADPIPDRAIEGILLSVVGKSSEDPGKLLVGGKVDLSRFVRPMQIMDFKTKGHGKIHLPAIHSVSVPFNVRVDQDKFTLLGTYVWPTETGEKKNVVVLLRAAALK